MQKQKQDMVLMQQELAEQKVKEKAEQEKYKIEEANRKIKEQEDQKIRDEQRRQRNIILEQLEREKKVKAIDILNILTVKGFKKIGKEKIKDLEADPERADYDNIIEFYQNVLRKEREQIEEEKKKKLREVELWTRALREEEKLAMEKYAVENGDSEIKQIQASIAEKQSKELKDKEALSSAKPFFEHYMVKAMQKRT